MTTSTASRVVGVGQPPKKRRSDLIPALGYLAPGMSGFLLFIVAPLLASLVISLYLV